MNQIILSGRIVSEPVFSTSNKGSEFATIRVVHKRKYFDSHGESHEESDFYDCKLGGKVVEKARDLKKGDLIHWMGWLQQEHWIDQTTNKERYKVIIKVHGFERAIVAREGEAENWGREPVNTNTSRPRVASAFRHDDYDAPDDVSLGRQMTDDDEIPF